MNLKYNVKTCSQIFIFNPNKCAAASISVAVAKPFICFIWCQFIYTAELCKEKVLENVSIPHLSVQNKTARV
jgi:hypothetical protein